MAISEFELAKYNKVMSAYIERNRPPGYIREKLDLGYRITNQSIEIVEIRPQWNDENKKIEQSIAKATYVKTQKLWKVFWQRADLKWHRYEPMPTVKTLEQFVQLVERDENACFFG